MIASPCNSILVTCFLVLLLLLRSLGFVVELLLLFVFLHQLLLFHYDGSFLELHFRQKSLHFSFIDVQSVLGNLQLDFVPIVVGPLRFDVKDAVPVDVEQDLDDGVVDAPDSRGLNLLAVLSQFAFSLYDLDIGVDGTFLNLSVIYFWGLQRVRGAFGDDDLHEVSRWIWVWRLVVHASDAERHRGDILERGNCVDVNSSLPTDRVIYCSHFCFLRLRIRLIVILWCFVNSRFLLL